MKKMTKLAFGVGIAAIITGCGVGPQPPKTYPINFPNKEVNINFNFPKTDPITKEKVTVNFSDLKKQIADDMVKYSKYGRLRGPLFAYSNIVHYDGVKVNITNKNYKLIYANGIKFINDNSTYLNQTIFNIPYKLDSSHITLKYPNTYTQINCYNPIGQTIKPLDTLQNLKKDVVNILDKLSKTNLYIKKHYLIKGEVNSSYNKESIYANFERLLGKYKKDNVDTSKNLFNLKLNNKIFPLEVTIYPYRNGSKVIYQILISYKLFSNGTSSLTKKDIEKVKELIEKVVNN